MNFCAYVCDICNTPYADGNKNGHPKYFCLSESKLLSDNKFKMKQNITATICPKCYNEMYKVATRANAMTTNRQFIVSLVTKMIFDKEVLPHVNDCSEQVIKTELQELVDQLRELNSGDYTLETWASLIQVLNCAIMTLADRYTTQDIVDEMLEKLQDAQENLELDETTEAPDKDDDETDDEENQDNEDVPTLYTRERLKELIDSVDYLSEEEYTPESWALVTSALEYANEIFDLLDPTAEQLKLSIDDLLDAITNIVEVI